MDPVRNPYAPGAGQRPPELAGRDAELAAFEVVLERVAHGRPERSIVLTGLRGVGKTVLLNAMRSAAVRRGWGTGKLEARPDQPLRRPLAAALHLAIRELAASRPRRAGTSSACSSPSRNATDPGRPHDGDAGAVRDGRPADAAVAAGHRRPGRARSGGFRRHRDRPRRASGRRRRAGRRHRPRHRAVHRRDAGHRARRTSPRCAPRATRLSQQRLPLVLVGAGLPHLPAVLAASKSYSERLFRYQRIDRLDRAAADAALRLPARDEDADFDDEALDAMYAATSGYPYFVQAYGKVAWDVAPRSPITADDVAVAAPEAEAELAVGFFGSRFERATPAEREYLRAMADLDHRTTNRADIGTSAVADALGRNAQSLSPARDALLKKGLVYSGQRGRIAFTVPHFGRYLQQQDA